MTTQKLVGIAHDKTLLVSLMARKKKKNLE